MNRTDLLNHLAEKYQLKRYLEIGVQVPALNFDKIKCPYKVGVDPDPKANATYCETSDYFFQVEFDSAKATGIRKEFDLVFIDGLHTAEQVKKDFENALKVLSPNGFIVLHDVNPATYERTLIPRPTKTGTWNGSVWRFAVALNGFDDIKFYTVDEDHGVMVVQIKNNSGPWGLGISEVPWQYFDAHRKQLLNLISYDEFVALGS